MNIKRRPGNKRVTSLLLNSPGNPGAIEIISISSQKPAFLTICKYICFFIYNGTNQGKEKTG
jgi:hypothetical protein